MKCVGYISVLLFNFIFIASVQCELITVGIVSALSGIGYYAYEKYKCVYQECCTDEYIFPDFDKLDYLLTTNLYGQQIAHGAIMGALRAHFYSTKPSSKALVMSFHGTPGTGKNYVVQMIVTTLYKKGSLSKYYHFFNGRTDFPLQRKVDEYKEELYKIITSNLRKCERSIFVFDEVDKMPEGLMNTLVPFLDYNNYHKSSKHSELIPLNKAIFIFLSNTGSSQIVEHLVDLWQRGMKREDTRLQNFEKLIANGAFLEKGGFHLSDTIQNNVIDHYVPFMPLEEEHVRKCVIHAFAERGMVYPSEEMIQEVLSHLTFGPEPLNLFSMSGCKRIEQKVATVVYRKHTETRSDKS